MHRGVTSDTIADLEAAGAPLHIIDEMREQISAEAAGAEDDDFEVWSDCWDALVFFLGLSGDWNCVSGMASLVRLGIPSDRIESAMNLAPIPKRKRAQMYADVKLMESAVVAADRELRAKE